MNGKKQSISEIFGMGRFGAKLPGTPKIKVMGFLGEIFKGINVTEIHEEAQVNRTDSRYLLIFDNHAKLQLYLNREQANQLFDIFHNQLKG